MRLLVSADLHIGRRSSRLPPALAAELTPAAAWRRIVDTAVDEGVDAVLLAGDIADAANAFYEALRPLEDGAARLADADIPLLAVAGNHDWDVLHRLEQTLPNGAFHLLGRRGIWQRHVLAGAGNERLQVFGWSFPQAAVRASPLPDFPTAEVDPAFPAVGLMHADLDAGGGAYCPVARREFDATGVPLWLLGHVHRPTAPAELEQRPRLLYPGSPQGLDPGPGETGRHGPWLITWDARGPQCSLLPLAVVRYDRLTVELAGIAGAGELQTRLAQALRQAVAEMQAEQPALRCVVLRLCLTGRCDVHTDDLQERLAELRDCPDDIADLPIVIDGCDIDVLPPLDLVAAAAFGTPLGRAAQLFRELSGDVPESAATSRLLARVRRDLGELYNDNAYSMLKDPRLDAPPDEQACRDLLRRQTGRLIERLTAQHGGDRP